VLEIAVWSEKLNSNQSTCAWCRDILLPVLKMAAKAGFEDRKNEILLNTVLIARNFVKLWDVSSVKFWKGIYVISRFRENLPILYL
jgi:hypothetical protein